MCSTHNNSNNNNSLDLYTHIYKNNSNYVNAVEYMFIYIYIVVKDFYEYSRYYETNALEFIEGIMKS